MGNSTSGKSTLGRALVDNGLYDAYVETDDLWRWVSGTEEHPWRSDVKDSARYRELKDKIAAHAIPALERARINVCTSVWPGLAVRSLLERLQDYRVIVLKGLPREEAKTRFIERGSTADEFESCFPGDSYSRNEEAIMKFATTTEEKGKLLDFHDYEEAVEEWMTFYPGESEEEEELESE